MSIVKVITNKNQEAIKAFMLKDEVWFTFCDDSSDKEEYQPPFGSRAVWLDIIVDDDFAGMVLVENDNLSTLKVHPYLLKQHRKHVREFFNRSITITSGNRCPAYNKKVGGATKSYHPRGRAADIQVENVSPDVIHQYLTNKYPDQYGIGKYNSFTHIDTRSNKARWGH